MYLNYLRMYQLRILAMSFLIYWDMQILLEKLVCWILILKLFVI